MPAYEDFPALFRAADTNSLKGQRHYLWATKCQLGALIAAAALGVFSWQVNGADVAAAGSVVAFCTAVVTEVYLLKERPERMWYEGRAVAESAKTLTWRYMVGGSPMGREETSTETAAELLLTRFTEIETDVEAVWLVPDGGTPEQVTAEMTRVRQLSLDERRAIYLRERIGNQREWYGAKSRWNERRSTMWSLTLTVLELLGVSAGVMKVTGIVDVDLLGVCAALAAGGTAWVQTKQHKTLATAYAVARHELATIAFRAQQPVTEAEWATFVANAEDAVSREHTLWRASHM
ncbi:DUF4231 domain-containing protein [Streptomyces sp. SAJ15]|uniref:DUF4231 domain-containing protein n=1 Tax=Streptomyces sp. SAJ15 TaxID=2011095 RepID=UPI00118560BE|nr:DUF4231 domain-containing protein [Streptomyces sp. SAJ15]TVL88626.1 hypothetical protein CD790_30325 [Streptomyces sp. SAJ15]